MTQKPVNTIRHRANDGSRSVEAAIWKNDGRGGRPPSTADGKIAAVAHINERPLVTASLKEFRGFKDLVVEDWCR